MKKILCTALVCYPESIPNEADLFSEIEKSISVGFKYILHDKDKTKDGKLKKPHYHLLFQGILTQAEWKGKMRKRHVPIRTSIGKNRNNSYGGSAPNS